jgi:hypothetical protein
MAGPGRAQPGTTPSASGLALLETESLKRAGLTRQKKKQLEVRECFEFAFFRAGC